jgi:hypothetical protein
MKKPFSGAIVDLIIAEKNKRILAKDLLLQYQINGATVTPMSMNLPPI